MSSELRNDFIVDCTTTHSDPAKESESIDHHEDDDFRIVSGEDVEDVEFTEFKLLRRKSKKESVNGLRLADMAISGDWRYSPIDKTQESDVSMKERLQANMRKALQELRYVRINEEFFAKDLFVGIEFKRMKTREKIDFGILFRALLNENKSLKEHFVEHGLISNQIVYKRIK